ncbi:PREDICTED: cysteine-rich PDZ-binding protein isoform X1 [Ficedula albicollis]|uniref:cysteine-rich PDZ-binding protein isoform X1 n=1 Tax=Ficedula albicollis TaxID=59894 RepID=UPI000359FD9F|nr:PREDICTED: cysteine-rich PDZ-binding protein isoform X1 [Ficedula albicollis]
MVCDKCEKKLGTVITPDTWKDGARNTTESGGRKLNENKALTSKKARFDPYGKNKFAICRICKSSVHQPGSHYCQGCAYKKGEFHKVPKYPSLAWDKREGTTLEFVFMRQRLR